MSMVPLDKYKFPILSDKALEKQYLLLFCSSCLQW